MKRFIYLLYYLKKLDRKLFSKFLTHVSKNIGKSRLVILVDVFTSSIRYNISLMDYFYFRFYKLDKEERKTYAGTGFMYEYQLKMNPAETRGILEDKILFFEKYQPFINRKRLTLLELIENEELIEQVSNREKLVLKSSTGQVGAEVEVIKIRDFSTKSLIDHMIKNNFNLIEEFVIQHDELMKLSPSGLNTVRIITQLYDGKVEFLGARLRISVNSFVDNLGAGNIAAPVDVGTGKIYSNAVYSDITKDEVERHPVSNELIVGFQIPQWEKTLKMIQKVAQLHPENRSIGWDIAITNNGPELIEGNHNWCKLLWQLPVKQGLKGMLSKYYEA
ncbi:MAG: hexapeptide transferase [Cyclobacteriaceae bacterium]|nr:hexapeptide transferase [Cyclobacteriaceae bacterium]